MVRAVPRRIPEVCRRNLNGQPSRQSRGRDRTFKLKFPRHPPEIPFSINHLRWISGLGF